VTTDVIEAACACLVATLEESSAMNESEYISERVVLEEFGRCLTRVIESTGDLPGIEMSSCLVTMIVCLKQRYSRTCL